MKKKFLLVIPAVIIPLVLIAWGGLRLTQVVASAKPASSLPVTSVKRGDVTITVSARGELQGGNSEMLNAPMVAGADLAITSLRRPGEMVKEGDVVVEFSTLRHPSWRSVVMPAFNASRRITPALTR